MDLFPIPDVPPNPLTGVQIPPLKFQTNGKKISKNISINGTLDEANWLAMSVASGPSRIVMIYIVHLQQLRRMLFVFLAASDLGIIAAVSFDRPSKLRPSTQQVVESLAGTSRTASVTVTVEAVCCRQFALGKIV